MESGRRRRGKMANTTVEESESITQVSSSNLISTQTDAAQQNFNTNRNSPPKKARTVRKPKHRTLDTNKASKEKEEINSGVVLVNSLSQEVSSCMPGPVSSKKMRPNSPLIDDQPWISTTKKKIIVAQEPIQKEGTSKRRKGTVSVATVEEEFASKMNNVPILSARSQATKTQKAGVVGKKTPDCEAPIKTSKIDEEGLLIQQEKTYNVRSTRSKSKVPEPTHVPPVNCIDSGRKKKNDCETSVVNNVEVIELRSKENSDRGKPLNQEAAQSAQAFVYNVDIDGDDEDETKPNSMVISQFDGKHMSSSEAERDSADAKKLIIDEFRYSSLPKGVAPLITLPESEEMTQFDEAGQEVEVLEEINGEDRYSNGFVVLDCKKPTDAAEVNSVIISDNDENETSDESDITVISALSHKSHNETRESMDLEGETESGANTVEMNKEINGHLNVVPESPYLEEEHDSSNLMKVDHDEEIEKEQVDNEGESDEKNKKAKEKNEKREIDKRPSQFLQHTSKIGPGSFNFLQLAMLNESYPDISMDFGSQDMFASQAQQQCVSPDPDVCFQFGMTNKISSNLFSLPNQHAVPSTLGQTSEVINESSAVSSQQLKNDEKSDDVEDPSSSLENDGNSGRNIKGILKRKANCDDDQFNSLNLSLANEPPSKKHKVTINCTLEYAPSPKTSLDYSESEGKDKVDSDLKKSYSNKRRVGAKRNHAHHRTIVPKSSSALNRDLMKTKINKFFNEPEPNRSIFLRSAPAFDLDPKSSADRSGLETPIPRECSSSLRKDFPIGNILVPDLVKDTSKEFAPQNNSANTVQNESEFSEIDLSNLEDPADHFKNSQSFSNPAESVTIAFPLLKDCKHSVDLVIKDLITPVSLELLEGALNAMKVKTIGDLCGLRIFEVLKLPIDPSPRLSTFRSVMTKYAQKIGSVNELPQTPVGFMEKGVAANAAKDLEYPDPPNLFGQNTTPLEEPLVGELSEAELLVSPLMPDIRADYHNQSQGHNDHSSGETGTSRGVNAIFPEPLNESALSPSNNNQISQFMRGDGINSIGDRHFSDLSEVEVANRAGDTEAESETYPFSGISVEKMENTTAASISISPMSIHQENLQSQNIPDFMNLRVVSKLKQFLKSDCEEAEMLCKLILSDSDIRKKFSKAQNEFDEDKELSILSVSLPTSLVPSVAHLNKDDEKASEAIENHVREILRGLKQKCESKLCEGVDHFKDWSKELIKFLEKDGDFEELSVQEILQLIKTLFTKLKTIEMRLVHEGGKEKGATAKALLDNLERNLSPTELLQILVNVANLVKEKVEQ